MEVALQLGMSYALVFGAVTALLCFAGVIGGLVWWARRPVAQRRRMADQPLQLFSHARASVWMREESDGAHDVATAELLAARVERVQAAGTPTWTATNGAPRANRRSSGVASAPLSALATSPPAEGASVRFSRPTDAGLELLPGRLEIITGTDAGKDVRFVRLPGAATADVTFGRIDGPAYRHVQLQDASVGRQHATMHLREGHWHLRNLSATNPVVRNGVPLAVGEVATLDQGDKIEMGKVTFRFQA